MTMLIKTTIKGMRAERGINIRPLNGMDGICGHNPTNAKMIKVVGMVRESKAAKLIMLK
jgi:hypothetical protein